MSQMLGSRKRVLRYFLLGVGAIGAFYFLQGASTPTIFYGICTILGITNGYWALFVTVAAEQFGTNMRATVATTVPNFVRGALVPIALGFQTLKELLARQFAADTALLYSGVIVGVVVLSIALLALSGLQDTFGKDLDYIET